MTVPLALWGINDGIFVVIGLTFVISVVLLVALVFATRGVRRDGRDDTDQR